MVKKIGCDICNKDFNVGTGVELKAKYAVNGFSHIADVCGSCAKEKMEFLVPLAWYKWNKDAGAYREVMQ